MALAVGFEIESLCKTWKAISNLSVTPKLDCRAVTAQLYGTNAETVRHRTLKLDRVSNVLSFVVTVRHK